MSKYFQETKTYESIFNNEKESNINSPSKRKKIKKMMMTIKNFLDLVGIILKMEKFLKDRNIQSETSKKLLKSEMNLDQVLMILRLE